MAQQQQQQQQQQGGNAPVGVGEMLAEDAEATPAQPSAPPWQEMDRIPGYQNIVNPDVNFVPPPRSSSQAPRAGGAPSPSQFRQNARLSEQDARDCLMQHVNSKCCWGKSAGENMTFSSIQLSTAVHYILRTFHESRSTEWDSEPFNGQPIDGPANGISPQPWDIQIPTPPWFSDQEVLVEVPHTASVKTCHNCSGTGRKICYSCGGWGCRRCNFCTSYNRYGYGSAHMAHGYGAPHAGMGYGQGVPLAGMGYGYGAPHAGMGYGQGVPPAGMGYGYGAPYAGHHTSQYGQRPFCHYCQGTGRGGPCYICNGTGRTVCDSCGGSGRVKCYIKMTADFKTQTDDFILERTPLPDHLIRGVMGTVIFDDTQPRLHPIRSFPEPDVNQRSEALIQQHEQLAQSGRILLQSHVIRGVSVFQCDGTHGGKRVQFFVYGNDREVHVSEYPQTCCCGCQLL